VIRMSAAPHGRMAQPPNCRQTSWAIRHAGAWPGFCGVRQRMRLTRLSGEALMLVAALAVAACSCDDPCKTNLDCGGHQACLSGECVNVPCRSDKECGSHRICNVSFQCIEGCRFNEDCAAGSSCGGFLRPNICTPGCTADTACPLGQVCIFRSCQPSCRSTFDCPARSYCPSESDGGPLVVSLFRFGQDCRPGCHDDGECGSSGICKEGTCYRSCEQVVDCRTASACVLLNGFGDLQTDAGVRESCMTGERCVCFPLESLSSRSARDAGPDATAHLDGGTDARANSRRGAPDSSSADAQAPDAHGSAADSSRQP
jgi:hypothetical protein